MPTNYPKNVQAARTKLRGDETIAEWVEGLCESALFGAVTTRTAAGIATEQRVLIYIPRMFGGYDLHELPYSRMSSIALTQGTLFASIRFIVSNNSVSVTHISKGKPILFCNFVRDRIEAPVSPAPGPPPAGNGLVDELERLAALHRAGALTTAEFASAKRKLIG
ncbi:MAG: PH domain-containing protein [Bryobacterales bacterium]|jgi:hypothetical protein|nr:PH domain-containing protein [Bryobacterales bacterium]